MSTRSTFPLRRGSSGVTGWPERSGKANRNGCTVSAAVSAVGDTRCGAPVLRTATYGVWVRRPAWKTPRRASPPGAPPDTPVVPAVGEVRRLEALRPVPEFEDPRAPPAVGDERRVPAPEQRGWGLRPRPAAAARAGRNGAGGAGADVPVHPRQGV